MNGASAPRERRHWRGFGFLIVALPMIWGCGREIIPIPLPCPPCEQTANSSCDYVEMEDGTRIRTQYTRGDPALPLVVGAPGLGGWYNDIAIIFPPGLFSTLSLSPPGGLCSDCLPAGTPHTVAKATEAFEAVVQHHQDLLNQYGEQNVLFAGGSYGALVVANYFARHPTSNISAIIVVGQDTPLSGGGIEFLMGYLKLVSLLFPLVNNTHLQQYLDSARTFDVSREIVNTRNRWLIIGAAEDEMLPGSRAMADRLGERARYAEFPGSHMTVLLNGASVRQIISEQLDFLLYRDGAAKSAAAEAGSN